MIGFVVRPHPKNRDWFDIGYYTPDGEWVFCYRDFDMGVALDRCAYFNGSGQPSQLNAPPERNEQ